MLKTATSFEQSKRLIELGVDRETSDMCYLCSVCDSSGYVLDEPICDLCPRFIRDVSGMVDVRGIPAWTLSTLMDLLPKNNIDLFDLRYLSSTFDSKGNQIKDIWAISKDDMDEVTTFYEKDPIDAVVDMIEFLYLKNDKK